MLTLFFQTLLTAAAFYGLATILVSAFTGKLPSAAVTRKLALSGVIIAFISIPLIIMLELYSFNTGLIITIPLVIAAFILVVGKPQRKAPPKSIPLLGESWSRLQVGVMMYAALNGVYTPYNFTTDGPYIANIIMLALSITYLMYLCVTEEPSRAPADPAAQTTT